MSVQTYLLDKSHSSIQFRVRHLGFSKVTGRFDAFSGQITMDSTSVSTLVVDTQIEAASVNTGDPQRDAHLRSADFFDTEQFAEITFKSRDVCDISVGPFRLTGDLTIHGITAAVDLDATYLGETKDPWGNLRVAFEAKTKINRKDFGLTWNNVLETGGLLVGEEVEIMLSVQAVLQAEQEAA